MSASAGARAAEMPPASAQIAWTSCGSYECGTLDVPIDYAAPDADTIELSLKRRKASGMRIGSLLINPGGPGGSAIEFLETFVEIAGNSLLERFDIVAFDPRGVGASSPIECHSTLAKLIAADPTPDDDVEWKIAEDVAIGFADECAQKYPKLLPHLGTSNVARDMNRVRAAIGDDKLTYFGFSYGTAIGARYADLFPERVRALVLDGALDMSLPALDISLQQAQGFEQALSTYFEWCSQGADRCEWAASMSPAARFMQLSAAVDAKPLTARIPIGPGEFLLGVLTPLYGGEDGYRILSQGLDEATRGDGTTLMRLVDSYLQRRPDGTYPNMQEANAAVNCVDAPVPDAMSLRAEASRFETASPIFGLPLLTGAYVCAHWPVHTQREPAPIAKGAAPILVVGTTGDPATPYAWAEAMSAKLESGVLLTHEGEGHTAYARGVSCIDNAIERYLIDGNAPQDGTRCAGVSGNGSGAGIAGAQKPKLVPMPGRGPWPSPRWIAKP